MSKEELTIEVKSVEEWFDIGSKLNKTTINCNPNFVKIVSKAFLVNPMSWIVYKKGIPIVGLLGYNKGKSIIHPTTYIYTAIWQNDKSEFLIQEALLTLLNYLKGKFRNISFLLPPEFNDIRPFIFSGFKPYLFYTFIKSLNDLSANYNLRVIRKKCEGLGVKFVYNDLEDDLLKQHTKSFLNLGYSKKYVNKIHDFFLLLHNNGFVKAVSARLNDELLASAYILLDKEKKSALNLLVTSDKLHYQTGVHPALYLNMFDFLAKEGIEKYDLYGFGFKQGISDFKSKFRGDLKPHYLVKYNYTRSTAIKIWKKLKPFTIKLLKI